MRKFLLYSSTLVLGLSGAAEAACIQTPTCSSLGYTSSSACDGGIKCPFGNAWNCTAPNKITELEKIIENIQQSTSSGDLSNCHITDFLYSDKTCSPHLENNKIPIAVVFDPINKLAVSLTESSGVWATTEFDAPKLPPSGDTNMQGKNNTKIMLDFCKANGKTCPAFEYVNKYKTAGTKAGDWYLPAAGEMLEVAQHLDSINIALDKASKSMFEDEFYTTYWTSCNAYSVYSEPQAIYISFPDGSNVYSDYTETRTIRPIINYADWEKEPSTENTSTTCKLGDILYVDKSCSVNIVSSKTPIGLVFDATKRLALGITFSRKKWSTTDFDVPGLKNYTSGYENDWDGKNNTKIILDYCKANGKSCPAVEYVSSYQTEGTKAGDWYLPSAGEASKIAENIDILDETFEFVSGGYSLSDNDFWTSTEYNEYNAYYLNDNTHGVGRFGKDASFTIIPILKY